MSQPNRTRLSGTEHFEDDSLQSDLRRSIDLKSRVQVESPFVVRKNRELLIPDFTQDFWYDQLITGIYKKVPKKRRGPELEKAKRWQYQDLMAYVISAGMEYVRKKPSATKEEILEHLTSECCYPIGISRHQLYIIESAIEKFVKNRDEVSSYRANFRERAKENSQLGATAAILGDLGFEEIDPRNVDVIFAYPSAIVLEMYNRSLDQALISGYPPSDTNEGEKTASRSLGFYRNTPYPNPELDRKILYTRGGVGHRMRKDIRIHEKAHAEHRQSLSSEKYTLQPFDRHSRIISMKDLLTKHYIDMYTEEIVEAISKKGFEYLSQMDHPSRVQALHDLRAAANYLERLKDETIAYMRENKYCYRSYSLLGSDITEINIRTPQVKNFLVEFFFGLIDVLRQLERRGYPAKSLWLKITTSESIEEAIEKLKTI